MANLPATTRDCRSIRRSGNKYGITDAGPDNIYIMENAPTLQKYQKAIRHITKRLQDNPETGHLILACFAGHGVQYNGQQALLTNEFDDRTSFYKMCHAERKVRTLTGMFRNAYVVAVFICCRDLSDKERHIGGVSPAQARELEAEGKLGSSLDRFVGRLEKILNATYEEFEEQFQAERLAADRAEKKDRAERGAGPSRFHMQH